jgi:hypothetical protein
MTLNKLASLIAKREGKKSQAHIGDVREILKIIVDDRDLVVEVILISEHRAEKRMKQSAKRKKP